MLYRTSAALAALCFAPLFASAQGSLHSGYQHTGDISNPAPWSTYVTLGDGTRVHFDGSSVSHHSADGAFLNTLHVFPNFVFYGAIAADPSGDSVLVCESSNGDCYRVELDGTGATLLANLPYNYSAAYAAPGVVFVSAAVCGWSCGNDIIRIDTQTGSTSTIAQVSGPSGPIAFDSAGNLYYGPALDAFPAPAGAGALWRFDSASLGPTTPLGDADATVLCTGIDPVSSIAIDPVLGDIVVSTNLYDGSFAVIEDSLLLLKSDGTPKGMIASSAGAYRSHVELRQTGGLGHFRAYQPLGVSLTSMTSDTIHTIDPARPTALITHSGGNSYALEVHGAEPNGALLVTYGNSAFHEGFETSYILAFDFLFHTGMPLNRIRRVGQFYMPCDATGSAHFPFWDSGALSGTVVFQGVITDSSGAFIGSSESAFH